MNNCLFCERSKIEKDILWESDNFFVKVGVGILAPGHILLITKHHIRCFGELDKKHFKEFLELKKNVFDKVKANFSEPIISEQGGYGQSVPHAHLHFVPTISNVHNIQNIKEKVFRGLKSTKIESMNEKNNPLVSVVNVTWNGKQFLKKHLPSLKNLEYPNYEVIIVDNESSFSLPYVDSNSTLINNNYTTTLDNDTYYWIKVIHAFLKDNTLFINIFKILRGENKQSSKPSTTHFPKFLQITFLYFPKFLQTTFLQNRLPVQK